MKMNASSLSHIKLIIHTSCYQNLRGIFERKILFLSKKARIKVFLKEQNNSKHNHENLGAELYFYVFIYFYPDLYTCHPQKNSFETNFIIEKYEAITKITCQIF